MKGLIFIIFLSFCFPVESAALVEQEWVGVIPSTRAVCVHGKSISNEYWADAYRQLASQGQKVANVGIPWLDNVTNDAVTNQTIWRICVSISAVADISKIEQSSEVEIVVIPDMSAIFAICRRSAAHAESECANAELEGISKRINDDKNTHSFYFPVRAISATATLPLTASSKISLQDAFSLQTSYEKSELQQWLTTDGVSGSTLPSTLTDANTIRPLIASTSTVSSTLDSVVDTAGTIVLVVIPLNKLEVDIMKNIINPPPAKIAP